MSQVNRQGQSVHANNTIDPKQKTDAQSWWRQIHPRQEQPENYNWVLNERAAIVKILERTTKPYAQGTKGTMYSTLGKFFRLLSPEGANNKWYLKYAKLSSDIARANKNKNTEAQQFTTVEKERFVSYPELLTRTDKNVANMTAADPYTGLVGALYNYRPPIRNDYSMVKIITGEVPDDNKNYIKKGANGKWTFYLRDYKTVRKYLPKVWEFDEKLSKVITKSVELKPREWLLASVTNNEKPMGKAYVGRIMDKNYVNVSLMRKVYASYFWDKWQSNIKKTKTLAENFMLHSRAEAESSYRKFKKEVQGFDAERDLQIGTQESDSDDEEPVIVQKRTTRKRKAPEPEKENQPAPNPNRLLGNQPYDPSSYHKVWTEKNRDKLKENQRKYDQANKEKRYRSKLVCTYNKYGTKPTEETIARFNLRQVGGKWV